VPGVTINRFCSSGVQSIAMAAERIRAGWADCILAGGTESMTAVPMMGNKVVGSRTVMDHHPEFYLGMGMTAENVAKDYKVAREDQDKFAYESHQRAVQAIEKGFFKEEIVPVQVETRRPLPGGETKVEQHTFAQDEGPRLDTTLDALTKLRPAFLQGGTVTAGNSSQMSDGAAMCLVVSEKFLHAHGLVPQARFCGFAVAGVPPRVMGIGPIEAIPKVLRMAGVKAEDIDHIELNEAFAAQALAVIRTCKLDPSKVNPYGGAIALGHPLGATGAKLTATLLSALHRNKQRYGMVTMCIGTGMGAAALFEAIR
jgi:acetyl-CoA acyltransferase